MWFRHETFNKCNPREIVLLPKRPNKVYRVPAIPRLPPQEKIDRHLQSFVFQKVTGKNEIKRFINSEDACSALEFQPGAL